MSEDAVLPAPFSLTGFPDVVIKRFRDTGWPPEVIALCRQELRLAYVWQLFRLIDEDFERAHLNADHKALIEQALSENGLSLQRELTQQEFHELFAYTFGPHA
jgi:hypothetical protein